MARLLAALVAFAFLATATPAVAAPRKVTNEVSGAKESKDVKEVKAGAKNKAAAKEVKAKKVPPVKEAGKDAAPRR
jgi:hypothetical protein